MTHAPHASCTRPDSSLPAPSRVHRRRRRGVAAALLLASLLCLAQPAQAQDAGCAEPGMNGQCSEFGAIVMGDQFDIRGEPVHVPVTIVLNTAYEEQSARWMLFSARSVEAGGATPVTIDLAGFSSDYGDVVTTRVEQPSESELNLWVDTLDTPLDTPITIDLLVGATELGAFRLESLVMAFDRGYEPIQDSSGQDATLYSFTMLGVNGETGGAPDGQRSDDGNDVPALGVVPVAAALAAAVALLRRRSA